MAGQAAFFKAVAKQLPHLRCFGQGNQTLAHIAGRQHAQLVAQLAGGAAAVGHTYQGGQIVKILFKSAKQRKTAGTAANNYNLWVYLLVHWVIL